MSEDWGVGKAVLLLTPDDWPAFVGVWLPGDKALALPINGAVLSIPNGDPSGRYELLITAPSGAFGTLSEVFPGAVIAGLFQNEGEARAWILDNANMGPAVQGLPS